MIQASEIMRCPKCGEKNPDATVTCCICNAPLKPFRRIIIPSASSTDHSNAANSPASTSQNARASVQPHTVPVAQTNPLPSPSTIQVFPKPVSAPSQKTQNQIHGRVIFVGQVEHQPAGFCWYTLLTRCLWFMLLILSLLSVLCALLMKVGLLVAFLIAGPAVYVLFWIFRKNPVAFIQTFFLLIQSRLLMTPFRQGPAATQPVRSLRVRDKTHQQEFSVWIKGHFSSGDIIVDDDVTIWGRWRDGSFVFTRAFNQRTGARITLRPSKSKVLFLASLLITVCIACAFYSSAVSLLERLRQ